MTMIDFKEHKQIRGLGHQTFHCFLGESDFWRQLEVDYFWSLDVYLQLLGVQHEADSDLLLWNGGNNDVGEYYI